MLNICRYIVYYPSFFGSAAAPYRFTLAGCLSRSALPGLVVLGRIQKTLKNQKYLIIFIIQKKPASKARSIKYYKVLRPGFEPESSARKAGMIGRTTLPEHDGVF
jgi:hypothetical protein